MSTQKGVSGPLACLPQSRSRGCPWVCRQGCTQQVYTDWGQIWGRKDPQDPHHGGAGVHPSPASLNKMLCDPGHRLPVGREDKCCLSQVWDTAGTPSPRGRALQAPWTDPRPHPLQAFTFQSSCPGGALGPSLSNLVVTRIPRPQPDSHGPSPTSGLHMELALWEWGGRKVTSGWGNRRLPRGMVTPPGKGQRASETPCHAPLAAQCSAPWGYGGLGGWGLASPRNGLRRGNTRTHTQAPGLQGAADPGTSSLGHGGEPVQLSTLNGNGPDQESS